MGGAADGLCVAIALEEGAPDAARRFVVNIRAHAQFRVTCLDRRVNEVARKDRVVALLAGNYRKMARRMAGGGQQPNIVVELQVAAHEKMAVRLDDRQH